MGKVLVLILIALGTNVNAAADAEEKLSNNLLDRASVLNSAHADADLDATTIAKPVMVAGGVAMRPMTPVMGRVVAANAGREFGGTNKNLAGQGMPCTNYDEVITEFGWFGAIGGAKNRGKAAPAKKTVVTQTKDGKRVFGGTNQLLAGQGKACTNYDEPIQAFGWFGAIGGRREKSQVEKKKVVKKFR